MNDKLLGLLFATIASVTYGVGSILGKLSYAEGSNAFMYVFLRSFLAILPLAILCYLKCGTLKVSRSELKQLAILSICGTGVTTLLVFQSFNYIEVGTGVCIHFVFPIITAIGGAIFFKTHLTKARVFFIITALLGMMTFWDKSGGAGNAFGMTLSLLSGFTYAFYLLYLNHTPLIWMNPFKLAFYMTVFMSLFGFAAAVAFGQFTLDISPLGYLYSVIIALGISIFSLIFAQKSIQKLGAVLMSIVCLLEPISSVILGVIVLNESMSPAKLIGCFVVIASIALLYGYEMWIDHIKAKRLKKIVKTENIS